ncbi:fibrocystin-L-like isoform X2 [Babylonia areolata]
MYQMYTEMESVSANTGSTEGGQLLTISGQYFDDSDSPARVLIDGEECVLQGSLSSTSLICETPPSPSPPELHVGNRGLSFTVVNGTDDYTTANWAAGTVSRLDETYYQLLNYSDHVTKMEGVFVAPETSSFRFYLRSMSSSKFTLENASSVEMLSLTSNSWGQDGVESDIVNLTKDSVYQIRVETGSSGDSGVELIGRQYNTVYLQTQTGASKAEVQDLVFTSVVEAEVQKLEVTSTGTVTGSGEEQVITITGDLSHSFIVGFQGAFTEPLSEDTTDGEKMTTALNGLPSLADHSVSVSFAQTTDSRTYTVTFPAELGGVPEVELRAATPDDQVTGSVQTTDDGVPTLDYFTLEFGGTVTHPINVTATPEQVRSALEEAAGVRCHEKLSNGRMLMDCESVGSCAGERVGHEEPFCGRFSAMNPEVLYWKKEKENGYYLDTSSKTLCLAHKGPITSVWVSFLYKDGSKTKTDSTSFSVSSNMTEWKYICKDIYTLVKSRQPGKTSYQIRKISVKTDSDTNYDAFVDHMVLHRENTVSNFDVAPLMRMPQARPNGAFLRTVTVTGSSGDYTVTLDPYLCGNTFPLMSLQGASVSGSTASSSNSATFTLSSGGQQVSVTNTRQTRASKPIAGSFTVTFNGKTSQPITVTPDLEVDTVRDKLSAVQGLGDVDVERQGHCAAFTYTVTMATLGGDQPKLQINSQLTGNSVATSVTTEVDGSLWYRPIPGDMLKTVHSDPQVTTYFNGVPASCASGVDCSFTWSSSATPTITAISPTSGGLGTSVTVTGTGFDGANEEVTIGGTACTLTSSTSTSLQCTLSVGPNGPQAVSVRVPSKGLASGSVTFTFTSTLSSISPIFGSIQGGLPITLIGQGFASGATVTVGGASCDVTSASVLEMVCVVPAEASGSAGAVPVVVSQGSTTLTSPVDFTYSSSHTPVISAISVTSVSAWGGDSITIDGSGFGSSAPDVTVNGEALVVTSHSDTQLEAEFPPLPPGSYPLHVFVEGKGLADIRTNSISDITVTLKVTGLTPTRGSLYGGTLLTVTGQGFASDASLMEVKVGEHACAVDFSSSTELTCLVDYTGKTHNVTNQGTHKDYGTGYAYDPKQLSISEGDCVRWVWTTPSFVSGIAYGVYQTANDTAKVTLTDGFASPGASSANGQYEFCFNVAGDYFYWSGYVNSPYNSIYLRGQVTVTARTSSIVDLQVKAGGMEAKYDTGASSSPSTHGSCSGDVSLISGCTPTVNPVATDVSKFQFALHECATPYVTSISNTSATTEDTITFGGQGFGGTNCQNEITYAGVSGGVVTASSDSQVSFSISEQGPPPVGVLEQFQVRVGNRGHALMALTLDGSRRLALLPVISDMDPVLGSLAGGTLLTFTGSGFAPSTADVTVTIDGYSCVVQSATTTEVTCLTPSSSSAKTAAVEVTTYHNSRPFVADCRASQCSFQYAQSATPTLSAVTPSTISSPSTTLTLTGSGFGSSTADVTVTLGGAACSVSGVSDTQIVCSTVHVPAGDHVPQVTVTGQGLASADSSQAVTSEALLSSLSPSQGSTHGGTVLTLNGHGFTSPSTVTVGGDACNVTSETATVIQCVTQAHAADDVTVAVTSNGVAFPTDNFSFSAAATPLVSSVTPAQGQAGDSVVVAGSGFSSVPGENVVLIGGVAATVSAASATSLTLTLGSQVTGTFPVVVDVSGAGLSNDDVTFEYTLGSVSISPTTGTTAGGQTLTVTGSGFLPGGTDVTICGQSCAPQAGSVTATQLLCLTPPSSASTLTTCDVDVSVNSVTQTAGSQYTYDPSITPDITGVSPARGGTAGGTLLTITGSGFGTSTGAVLVGVGGATCDVQTVNDTQITCTTNSATSGDYLVDVNVNGAGSAVQTSANFQFIDVWSSPFTWGGNPPPVAGDMVVVPPGQILLLDENTERLAMLLIQGGKLVFDEKDLELHADNILITNGGTLQVGTESEPFPEQYTAIIKLYGHQRSRELPIYGTKMLALRDGTLDLHGRPTPVTWTELSVTATAGSTQLSLTTPVNWKVNDEIVIPSTSHRHSQIQNEVNVISAISADGLTLTLRDPLTYDHVVVEHTFLDGSSVAVRGEVGLLTHNVKVMGSVNDEWTEQIEACPDGFDTGEFTTQTCFQGRFGAETGSDQFGAHIIVHAPEKDTDAAVLRLSYIEISHAGQAFRMGRYPVHLHLNGDMSQSYVRGLGIHNSFNRAVNIHGTHNALVEHVVIYNIMGGAFFLEDGIETNNTFQYNLGVFVRPSSSLRNDDVTPATFWVTNPDNIIIHNHAAGGSHFGFWYRMHDHPEGPSFDANICPKHVPLNRFENNTAHSFGWFGLWIFEDMFPRVGGSCDPNSPHKVAVFETLTAWNCEKGAEAVNSGALQFKDFVLVNNEKAGYEGKLLMDVPQYDELTGPMVDGGKIVAHLGNKLDQEGNYECTKAGVVLPYQNGLIVRNVQFYNFDRAGCSSFEFTRISGTCGVYCGAFSYVTKGLQYENTINKVHFEWESEGVIIDEDGTLTGGAGQKVIPTTPTLPPSKCTANVAEMSVSGVPGSVCDSSVKFHRFSFNNILPSSLQFKNVLFKNQYGTSSSPFTDKRISHPDGWAFDLVDGECYEMEFENAGHIGNISYNGVYYQFDVGDTVCITQKASKPDRLYVQDTQIDMSDSLPTPAAAKHGDWYYDEDTGKMTYYIKRMPDRRKRAVHIYDNDLKVDFRAYRCYYDNCVPPPDLATVDITPDNAIPWSAQSSWAFNDDHKPVKGDNVTIPADKWLVIDEDIPPLDFLIIEGGLSAAPDASLDFTLDVNYIIIYGRLVIGWEQEPFNGTARIILRGNHSTPDYPTTSGVELGSKFIAVYGGLDLHGVKPDVKWSRLASTANPGDTTLTLEDSVTWSVGDEVMMTTTDSSAWHTETFRLTAVSGNVITLNSSVQYRHTAHSETLTSGDNLKLTSRVALLTRNIVIEGGSYPDLVKESFGARVIVGKTVFDGESRNGFAKVEDTEFYHTGQEGWTEPYDPRYSLAFVDVLSDNTTNFYSYVRDNSFHNGFSPAIGVFAVDNLEVSGNVIHHTVYHAIHTNSIGTRLEGNLMALNIWSGAYLDRLESKNINFDPAVEAMDARDLVLRDNVVAGSERMGYHVPGQDCSTQTSDLWTNNEVHSCLTGVGLFGEDTAVSSTCTKWSGFRAWRNADWGLYLFNTASMEVEDLVGVENGASLLLFVMGPSSTTHDMEDKAITVRDSVFVGRTSSFDCSENSLDSSDPNVRLSGQARGWRYGSCGRTAIAFPNFVNGSNDAPTKGWTNSMSYQALKGIMNINNVVFEHFTSDGAGSRDVILSTNQDNDDLVHPVRVSGLSLSDVDSDSKVFFHDPVLGRINPSDCVDMDCDGMKKALVEDTDGSLLGSPGYVLPNAGFEWDGDPRRGIGDYRIPTVMLTDTDGSRIDASTKCPNKGIYNFNNCQWMSTWNAYQCGDSVKYALLTIESMDEDTETRRLSPVAVYSGGYVDLLNGPQDHGWCSGYTCRKRLSTFPAIVPLDRWVDMYLSSTAPKHMRFFLQNVSPTDCVGLSIFKAEPYRLDVSLDGQYVLPQNMYTVGQRYFTKTETTPNEFMPDLANKVAGQNYLRFQQNTLYWMQCGTGLIEYRMANVLVVSFGLPAMTDEEFFGEQIVNNLAQFLSIPVEKVRIVDVVREDGGSRRKRSTGLYYFLAEVGDAPGGQASDPVDLDVVTEQVVTQVQLYGMDEIINATIVSISVLDPTTASSASGGESGGGFETVRQVGSLELKVNPAGASENAPFTVQPVLQFKSPEGELVEYLGTHSSPWEVEVSLLSGGDGNSQLLGTKVATFVGGVAQFSDLLIDLPGENFVLTFTVVKPEAASNYSLQSLPFDVSKRPVALLGAVMTHHPLVNAPIQLSFRLVDHLTNQHITDLGWRGHTWTVTASLAKPELCPGRLEGDTSATFDSTTSTAEFTNIVLTDPGLCFVTFTLTSDPPEYEVGGEVEVPVMTSAKRDLKVEERREVEVRLALTFDPATARYFAAKVRNHYGQLKGVRVGDFKERPGSVVVTLTIEGSTEGMDAILKTMCDDIHQGVAFTYDGTTATLTQEMSVDGKKYYGAVCHADDDPGLHPGVIAAIVLACVLVIVVIVFVLLWRFKVYPKTKTYDTEKTRQHAGPYKSDNIEDVLFRDDTFMSLKYRDTPTPMPPVTTTLGPNLSLWRGPSDLPPMPGTPDPPRYSSVARESGAASASSRGVITPKPAQIDF